MDRYEDCTNLDRILEDYPGLCAAVVLDVETTGLDPVEYPSGTRNYILQLSIISAHTGLKIYDGYFKPRKRTWPEAEAVNHITWDMVKDSPTFRKELPKIQEIISAARVIIGYNIGFDRGFLENSGVDFSKTRYWIDVMEDFAVWNGDLHSYHHSFTWQKLTKAAKAAGFDWSRLPPHNSLSDCVATLHVARWLQERNKADGWLMYYPPCYYIDYQEEYGCSDCELHPCLIRGKRRLATVTGGE